MAAKDGTAADPLIADLLHDPRPYSFTQAVGLLSALVPDGKAVGYAVSPEEEQIRFRADPSLAFPVADVTGIEVDQRPGHNDPLYRVTVTFMGLYGQASPLPSFYSEAIAQSDDEPNNRRDFLDLFNHRMISLVYRSWLRYRHYLQYRHPGRDHFSKQMLAFAGLGADAVRDKVAPDRPDQLLACVGLLALRTRSGAIVSSVISQMFGHLAVQVEEFVERWVTISPDQRCRLGAANSGLGSTAVAGARVRDVSGKFNIALGPLDFATFQRHLPDGADFTRLRTLVRFLMRDPLEFDVKLKLRREDVPPLRLGGDAPCRLGWSTWMGDVAAEEVAVSLAGDRAPVPAAAA